MSGFYLIVSIEADERASLEKWAEWLVSSRHMQDVIDAGPIGGEITLLDGTPHTLEVRYRFKDRASYEVYEREKAAALREETAKAVASFGARLTFRRASGELRAEGTRKAGH